LFFFNDTATTEIYTLSLHDALPIFSTLATNYRRGLLVMPEDFDPEFTQLRGRAFDRAWDRYYRPGRTTIDPEIARPELAKRIVELAKAGERDESALTAGGLTYLFSLTPEPPDMIA